MPKLDLEELMRPKKHLQTLDMVSTSPNIKTEEVKYELIEPEPPPPEEDIEERIPFVLRNVSFERFTSQGQLIDAINKHVPQNEYHMPLFIYRPDFLIFDVIKGLMLDQNITNRWRAEQLEGILTNSIMHLKYAEGFPTDDNGRPIWERWEFETPDDHKMFMSYLEMGGSRAIHKMVAWPIEQVLETSRVNYWGLRVEAFDIYRVAHHERIKLHRALDVEDSHFNVAQSTIAKLSDYLKSITAEDLKELGLKGAVDAFEKLAKIQRLSVGLKDRDSGEMLKTPSMTKIMQKLLRDEPVVERRAEEVDLLKDSRMLDMAQELIIQVQDAEK